MRPGDPFHALLGEHRIELAARTAIAIDHEDSVEPGPICMGLGCLDPGTNRLWNSFGTIMQFRGQAGQFEIGEAVHPDDGPDFAGQGAACDQKGLQRSRPCVLRIRLPDADCACDA